MAVPVGVVGLIHQAGHLFGGAGGVTLEIVEQVEQFDGDVVEVVARRVEVVDRIPVHVRHHYLGASEGVGGFVVVVVVAGGWVVLVVVVVVVVVVVDVAVVVVDDGAVVVVVVSEPVPEHETRMTPATARAPSRRISPMCFPTMCRIMPASRLFPQNNAV